MKKSHLITVGCDDLKDSVVDGKKGDIEGATTKIEHKDILLAFLLVHTTVRPAVACLWASLK